MTTIDGSPSWADIMSDDEDDDGSAPPADDMCDHLLRYFPSGRAPRGARPAPVPGELWVHLRSGCNYLSSLLFLYQPPHPGGQPFVVNSWRSNHEASPFRITYGIHNPAVRGLVITAHAVVPNFSWTPRLALEREHFAATLACLPPDDLLVLPAVNTDVVRVFCDAGRWFLADNHQVEPAVVAAGHGGARGPLLEVFNRCLKPHAKRGLAALVADLRPDRVWFFALFPERPDLRYVGSCVLLPHAALGAPDAAQGAPDLDFSLHTHLAPSVPILADLAEVSAEILDGAAYDPGEVGYTGMYDGVLLVNPATLFAVRLCEPDVVFLTPLLRGRQTVTEFLATQVVHAHLTDASRVHVDRVSHRWWKETLEALTQSVFGEQHAVLLGQMRWQVESVPQWIGGWMDFVSSLGWEEWQRMDVDLQRLYVLLDYLYDEDAGSWHRVLRNPKYVPWVAKLIVFTLAQYE